MECVLPVRLMEKLRESQESYNEATKKLSDVEADNSVLMRQLQALMPEVGGEGGMEGRVGGWVGVREGGREGRKQGGREGKKEGREGGMVVACLSGSVMVGFAVVC